MHVAGEGLLFRTAPTAYLNQSVCHQSKLLPNYHAATLAITEPPA